MRPLDPVKQERIIKAVFSLAGRDGLTGINISGISKEAGLSVGSLYTYFKSKEEVIQAAYSSVEHSMTLKMYERFDSGKSIRESLEKIYINALRYRLKHYDETVFIDQYIQSSFVQINLQKQVKEFELQNKILYDLIQKGKEEGIFIKQDNFVLISFINGSIRSSSNSIAQKLIPLTKHFIESCFEMAWKGISSKFFLLFK